jgi:exopolyphosphatase/guanosine-5'-triphosphate,3'-diphosphate pyrophosphatase
VSDSWDETDPALPAYLELCASVDWSSEHMRQVARIAAALWSTTRDLHRMRVEARRLLVLAALGHDVGYAVGGRKGHHKAAERTLLDVRAPGLDDEERRTIAAIARYHRRALPDEDKHPNYASLSPEARCTVDWCGGLLRLADGLDRAHDSAVAAVGAGFDAHILRFDVECSSPCEMDLESGRKKTGLLEAASGLEVFVEGRQAPR